MQPLKGRATNIPAILLGSAYALFWFSGLALVLLIVNRAAWQYVIGALIALPISYVGAHLTREIFSLGAFPWPRGRPAQSHAIEDDDWEAASD